MKNYRYRSMLVIVAMAALGIILLPEMKHVNIRTFNAKSAGAYTGIIVIDAGHGAFDAGKTGVNGAEEKTINLQIAQKLRRNLESAGYKVVMTRENDDALYSQESRNKKREDMNYRVQVINEVGADLAVSIHQNSFTDAKYSGAQVFYFSDSAEGRRLAECIQNSFVRRLDPDNRRKAKANSDYFILKHAKIPVVIAECGFLSNPAEAKALCDDVYQEKVAWAVMMGIKEFLTSVDMEKY